LHGGDVFSVYDSSSKRTKTLQHRPNSPISLEELKFSKKEEALKDGNFHFFWLAAVAF